MTRIRRTMLRMIIVVCGVAVAVAVFYQLFGHQVPAGQPSLCELTSDSLDSLKADFNASADGVRVLLLLSPT
jgi:hypothetical protein